MKMHKPSLTASQAVQAEPGLARLSSLAKESQLRLQDLRSMVPAGLMQGLRPGPIEDQTWCLLVPNNAVSAKIRQMEPALLAHLRTKGWSVSQLRIKISQT